MENFYIVTNTMKDKDRRITKEIQAYIEQNGKKCTAAQRDRDGHILPGSVPEGTDCAIVLEGDTRLSDGGRGAGAP